MTERLRAEEAVQRVRDLHQPTHPDEPATWCRHCDNAWPCATIRVLDGAPS